MSLIELLLGGRSSPARAQITPADASAGKIDPPIQERWTGHPIYWKLLLSSRKAGLRFLGTTRRCDARLIPSSRKRQAGHPIYWIF